MVDNVQPARGRQSAGAPGAKAFAPGSDRTGAREKVRRSIEGLVTQGKDQVAGRLGDLAGSIRHAGERLSEQQVELLARYADQAASKVDEMTDYLRERDLDELLQDTRDFARRRPEVFLGGAFVVGLLAARFLKSSAERLESDEVRGGAKRRRATGGGRASRKGAQ